MMAKAPKKIRLAPGSAVAEAVRAAKSEGAPVEFEDGEATYRFVPQTETHRHDEETPAWKALVRQPSAEELASRHALVRTILENRTRRVISPWTAADLVHAAREGRVLDG